MNVFKRALVQVRANIGKSLLIFIIFLMTMAAVSATFMISRMYNKTLTETFKEGNVPVYVTPEMPKTMFGTVNYNTMGDEPQITTDQYKQISELDGVESTDTNVMLSIKEGQLDIPVEMGTTVDINFLNDPKQITDEAYKDAYTFDYDQDAFKSDPNSIIINDQVLAENDLEVGDKITLDLNSTYTQNESKVELEEQELTIVGTYSMEPTQKMIDDVKADAEEYGYEPDLTFGYQKLQAAMPAAKGEELIAIYADDQEALFINVIYKLTSMDTREQFEKDVEALIGMPVDVEFNIYDNTESEMASSLATVALFKGILTAVIRFVVAIIIILLTVIITMFVRGRKKEIGILVALGDSKRNIYLQLLIEQFIILIVATLIEYPIMLVMMNSIAKENGFLSLGFDILPLGLTLLAGMLIVGIITIIPAIYTLRVKPKKILL